jgi:hypothetical protein
MAPNEVKRIEVQDVPENLVLKSTWHGHRYSTREKYGRNS